ncbi:unnamed protein product [Ilex paraguariensis]|uniref:Uncharacterized protein n=1 Tax=Ilex paraguariensis TaxID=185542 RepID=A0ABC8R2S3_9AQUA
MKNKQVGDQSCPKPPMVHSSGCPRAKQNKNDDHSSSLPNLVSSSNPNMVSSSIPTFFNRNSEEFYHNRFCHKPMLLERGAQLDKMTDVDCAIIFGFRHWNSIVQIDKNDKSYDELVRIFYANMHDVEKEDLKFKSYMRNVRFQANPDLISKILNVPSPFVVENTLTYPFKNLSDQPALANVATKFYGRPFNLNIMMHYGVVIHPTDSYKSPMSSFDEYTLKKSLGQTDSYNLDDYDPRASTLGSGDIVQMFKQLLVNQEEMQQEMKESLEQLREDTKESLK